jgi:hypothetical protein
MRETAFDGLFPQMQIVSASRHSGRRWQVPSSAGRCRPRMRARSGRERGAVPQEPPRPEHRPPQAPAKPATRALFALIPTLDHGCALSTLPMRSERTPPAAMNRMGCSVRVDLSTDGPDAAHCSSSALASGRSSRVSQVAHAKCLQPTQHRRANTAEQVFAPMRTCSKRTRATRGASAAAPAHAGGGLSRCHADQPRLSNARNGGPPPTTAPLLPLLPYWSAMGSIRRTSPRQPASFKKSLTRRANRAECSICVQCPHLPKTCSCEFWIQCNNLWALLSGMM